MPLGTCPCAVYFPPVAGIVEAVTYEAWSESAHTTMSAISAGSATLPIGAQAATRSVRWGSPAEACICVLVVAGATLTTRIPSGASSRPSPRVNVSTAAFEGAYPTYSPGAPVAAAVDPTFTITPGVSEGTHRLVAARL